MDSYLKHDLFKEVNNLILVEREVENGKKIGFNGLYKPRYV